MDDVVTAQLENEHLRKIRSRLLQWEASNKALAPLDDQQLELLDIIDATVNSQQVRLDASEEKQDKKDSVEKETEGLNSSADQLPNLPENNLESTSDFLLWYDQMNEEIHENSNFTTKQYLQQLMSRSAECSQVLEQLKEAHNGLQVLSEEYAFVAEKTKALNKASEQLIEEQNQLQTIADDVQQRLHHFNQIEILSQRLYSPTMSVSSDAFRECLTKIDNCLLYLQEHRKYKDAPAYTIKYKQCLNKAHSLIRQYNHSVMAQATEGTLHPKLTPLPLTEGTTPSPASPDATFALYYGKYQMSAAKIKPISQMIEERVDIIKEYVQLQEDLQQNYLSERSTIMIPAVDKAINDIQSQHKADHCALIRSACAFLVHICQDEQRLYYQFFTKESQKLTLYLESLCGILYDTMRPLIIHINHLETLAEICSILRIEMLEEHVQQNPSALEAFATVTNQLLQDVQERLVFRAHLYLQSDILNYNPSAGDLAYPDKLEMMESIALSLQENQTTPQRGLDSKSPLISTVSTSTTEAGSVEINTNRHFTSKNSPADMHGMWYPTVRRTLVCLSRLYRCVDRPIFQGLSQEALKLCIQSVSSAAAKISQNKTSIDGELFEIKHLLILREQIAPFRVDFTIKETSLDFSKVKTAAFGLLQKRKQLFAMSSNNALLEFLLDGMPQVKEHLLDSRKEVDRQLKLACEQFIKDAAQRLINPLLAFQQKVEVLLKVDNNDSNTQHSHKINYTLRQSAWASPQQINGMLQETQRLIKTQLPGLQRSMQLYLSNRDTEFIIFRPIRNNIIQAFVKLEQLLTTNGYSSNDMIIASCPTAEQVAVLLSSASILATEDVITLSADLSNQRRLRKLSSSSQSDQKSILRKTSTDRKVSFDEEPNRAIPNSTLAKCTLPQNIGSSPIAVEESEEVKSRADPNP